MKKFLVALALVTLAALSASADDRSNGCGLGWQVTSKASLSATSTRGTTNVIVPSTFGMTSGTIGCDKHTIVKEDEAPARFVVSNRELLDIEIAQGGGENLRAFARALGCADDSRLGDVLQRKYEALSLAPSELDLYFDIKAAVQADPELSKSCGV